MNSFIILVLVAASVNCQSPAFDSFMTRNRQLFSDVSVSSGSTSQSFGQQSNQQLPSWQHQQPQPQTRSSFGRSLVPSVSFASEPSSPFVTSNSHIQAFNPPQSAGSPTTISGPNFQTSITLPALPALPQHPAGSPAALATQQLLQQQQQQQTQSFQPQPQPQVQPQLTQQFTSHVHSHQIPSSQSVNQQTPASGSFFNSQGNTNFPFNFQAPTSAPLSLPTPPSTPPTAPQSFDSFGFNSFQGANNFFTNPQQQRPQQQFAQPQTQQPSAPWSSSSFGQPSTTIRAPGFETTFVFMRPSEQPDQGASLSKLIRGPNGVERQMFFVPMPNYSPPTVFNHQIVHSNPQQQQQGQQQ